MLGRAGPDGRRTVRVRTPLVVPLLEGDHVELAEDLVRWYSVVSCRQAGLSGTSHWTALGRVTLPSYELVLRESSPGERLVWEVMSS